MAINTTSGVPNFITDSAVRVFRTYSYNNNTGFYVLANKNYIDYFMQVIQYDAQWLDGWVMDFHRENEGILSTRLYTTLVRGVGNHIVGDKISFQKSKGSGIDALNFCNEKSALWGLDQSIRNAIQWALGLGTSALKWNVSTSDLWMSPVRLDTCFYEVDFRGKVIDFTCLVKGYTTTKKEEDNYYLVEHRFFKKMIEKTVKEINGTLIESSNTIELPMVEYAVHKANGITRTNTNNNFSTKTERMRWDSLPSKYRRAILNDFNQIELNKPHRLPFADHLGVELLKNNGGDITLPHIPFGASLARDIIAYLMSYDLAWSYYCRDMYLGKGMVIKPKAFSLDGNNTTVFSAFPQSVFEEYQSSDPDKQSPQSIQFDLRAEQWQTIQDNILKKIATTIGMSPKTIASYLRDDGAQKTAEEVRADDSSSLSYIKIARSVFCEPINKLLEVALNYYGLPDDITIKFATPSIVDQDKLVDRAILLLTNGLIDRKSALALINPDMDSEQVESLEKSIKEEEKAKADVEKAQWENNDYGV